MRVVEIPFRIFYEGSEQCNYVSSIALQIVVDCVDEEEEDSFSPQKNMDCNYCSNKSNDATAAKDTIKSSSSSSKQTSEKDPTSTDIHRHPTKKSSIFVRCGPWCVIDVVMSSEVQHE